jgi:hypothetical protein
MVRINQQGTMAGFQNACLCGEGRQSVLAEASGMVSIGRWRGALRISNPVSLIGIAAHFRGAWRDSIVLVAFVDLRELPANKTLSFIAS